MLNSALREPPCTAQLLTRAEALGLTFERWPLGPGVRALYCDRTLVLAADLPVEVAADFAGHWRYLLATALSAVEQSLGPVVLRWPIPETGEVPQDTQRAVLGAGEVLIGGSHRSLHHLTVEQQARYLGVPLTVWTRWVALHVQVCQERCKWRGKAS